MTLSPIFGYGCVSGFCLLLNNTILVVGDQAGLPLVTTIPLSFVLCVLAGYIMHSLISFRKPINFRAFLRYVLAMSGNIPLAFAGIWLARDVAGFGMVYAAPLATACILLVNYLLAHWAIAVRGKAL